MKNKNARIAGLLYVLLVICGLIYLIYVPSQIIIWDDASTTFKNLEESTGLFKIGIITAICSFVIFTLLPLSLYELLSEVNKKSAFLMVLFALISVPISFINILNKFSILNLLKKTNELGIENQVMFFFQQYSNGLEVLQIFWGLWLLPFGYLVFKSGYLPKLLGIFLMLGCFGYLISFFGGFFYEDYSDTLIAVFASLPGAIGEIGIAFWLLIMGTNKIKAPKNSS